MTKKFSISTPDRVYEQLKEVGNISNYLTHTTTEGLMRAYAALHYLKESGWTNSRLKSAAFRLGYYDVDFFGPAYCEMIARYVRPDAVSGGWEDDAAKIEQDPNLALALLIVAGEVVAGNQEMIRTLDKDDLDSLPPLITPDSQA